MHNFFVVFDRSHLCLKIFVKEIEDSSLNNESLSHIKEVIKQLVFSSHPNSLEIKQRLTVYLALSRGSILSPWLYSPSQGLRIWPQVVDSDSDEEAEGPRPTKLELKEQRIHQNCQYKSLIFLPLQDHPSNIEWLKR
jgi:hypothetical protein